MAILLTRVVSGYMELRDGATLFADHFGNRQPSRSAHLRLPAVRSSGDRSYGRPGQWWPQDIGCGFKNLSATLVKRLVLESE
jgi:hypothetical protein